MAQPFVGSIMMFGGNFPPNGWMFCAGQLLPISQYDTLFNLIGTTFGGDGQSTFALPDLQGRIALHQGTGSGLSTYVIGQKSGVESVTLNVNQIPQHKHFVATQSGTPGNQNTPSTSVILADEQSSAGGANNPLAYIAAGSPQVQLPNSSISSSGQTQPHDNIQPILAISYCISLFGIFPTQ